MEKCSNFPCKAIEVVAVYKCTVTRLGNDFRSFAVVFGTDGDGDGGSGGSGIERRININGNRKMPPNE